MGGANFKAALIVGGASAIGSMIPCLGGCICLLTLGFGGFGAAWLASQFTPPSRAFGTGDGMAAAVQAAGVHILIRMVLTLILVLFGATAGMLLPSDDIDQAVQEWAREADVDIPPAIESLLARLAGGGVAAGFGLASVLVEGLCLVVLLLPFFIGGGLIGGSVFQRQGT